MLSLSLLALALALTARGGAASSASTAGELVGSSNSIQLYIQNHLSSPIFAMAEIVALYAMGELPQSSDAAGAEDAIRKLLYAKVSS